MCPIRHFRENLVKFIEASQNLIFAADTQGQVAIFLIDENDLENDDETMQTESFKTNGVVFMKYIAGASALYIITVDGYLLITKLE